MSDDKDGLSLDYLGNSRVHFLLVFGINKGCRFVKHDDRGIFQYRPCKRNSLSLTARKHFTAVACHCVNAFRQTFQELTALCFFSRRHYFFTACIGLADEDILIQRGVEQKLLLRYIGDIVVQCFNAHIGDVLTAEGDMSAVQIIVMDKQLCKS